MKKYLLILVVLVSFKSFSQTQPRKLIGIDLVTNMPRYYNDTVRTIFYKPPFYVIGDSVFLDASHLGLWTLDSLKRIYRGSNVGVNTTNPLDWLQIDDSSFHLPVKGITLNSTQISSSSNLVFSPLLKFNSHVWLSTPAKDTLVSFYIQSKPVGSTTVPVYELDFLNTGLNAVASISQGGGFTASALNITGSVTLGGYMDIAGAGQFHGSGYLFGGYGYTPSGSFFGINSTTLGFVKPRLTSTQIAASSALLSIPTGTSSGFISSSGSGYTNGTFTLKVLANLSGTTCQSTIIVSGGAVTSVTIISSGWPFKNGDVLTCPSLAGGTGFTFTITSLTATPGVELYNSTNNVPMVYNNYDMVQQVLSVYRPISNAYTMTNSDWTVDCTGGGSFTVTLPTAVGISARPYVITNSGTGTITIATTSSQTFTNVTATPTSLTIISYGSYTIESTGTNWIVLSKL